MVGGENIRASIGFELRLHVDGIIERHPWNSKRPCQARIKREWASCEIIRRCLKKKEKKGIAVVMRLMEGGRVNEIMRLISPSFDSTFFPIFDLRNESNVD